MHEPSIIHVHVYACTSDLLDQMLLDSQQMQPKSSYFMLLAHVLSSKI